MFTHSCQGTRFVRHLPITGCRLLSACMVSLFVLAAIPSAPLRAECIDNDGDGFGSPGSPDCPGGPQEDCDDNNPDIFPGATELCNGVDDNCNGLVDEGFMLIPDSTVPVFGFDNDPAGTCAGSGLDCNVELQDCADESLCEPVSGRFNQIVQACVDDEGNIGDPCDASNPELGGIGSDCPEGSTCQPIPVPLGSGCIIGCGVCRAVGTVVCSEDGSQAVCDAVPGEPQVAVEGGGGNPQNDPLCFDGLDNDCDCLVDHENPECQTEEFCDGFDNNNNGLIDEDFPLLGEECTVTIPGAPPGTPCENTGVYVCNADGTGVKCNAVPLAPSPEICNDGIDNDCDGLIDCEDPDCIQPELCDGIDNNCDGQVDEDFPELGEPCTVGVGACERTGVYVCAADGLGTVCSATPGKPSPERLATPGSCSDGIDNDCDGKTDEEDEGCQLSTLEVGCSLEYARGKPGNDCTGWHVIDWEVSGASGDVNVSAELIALMPDGTEMAALPVGQGEEAHLASRLSEDDWKWVTRTTGNGRTRHEMFAPVPMLRVTARDDVGKAQAYCSNVPYLKVIEPDGGVVSASAGDAVNVLAAIPRVDPATLSITLDGVDILQPPPVGLGIDPAAHFPGGPFGGSIQIGSKTVEIIDLKVSTGAIDELSANTVSMIIADIGCGGHVIRIEGQHAPDAFPKKGSPSAECHVDDVEDTGDWSVFEITIDSPTEGEITDGGPVQVTGEVCHGLDISAVRINGHEADLSNKTVIPGDENTGSTIKVAIDEMIGITDVAAVLDGLVSSLGTFDPGPNKLIAQAVDIEGNTTYDRVPFVVGPALALAGAGASGELSLHGGVAEGQSDEEGRVHKAFTMILDNTVTDGGGKSTFETFFADVVEELEKELGNCMLQPRSMCCDTKFSMPWWTCDPNVKACVTPSFISLENFVDNFDTAIIPADDRVIISMTIPSFLLDVTAKGNCCTGGCGFFCVARTKVDFNGVVEIPNMTFEIEISEANIKQEDGEFTVRFIPGGESVIVSGNADSAIKTGCGLLSVGTLIDIATLGFRPLMNLIIDLVLPSDFTKEIPLCPFVRQIAGQDGMGGQVAEIKLDRDDLGQEFALAIDHVLEEVEITPEGISIAFGATIEPTTVDPLADTIVATLLTEAPLVQAPVPGARSLSVAIADDFFNQLLAGMVKAGKLKSRFTEVRELGNFVPDCSSIADEQRRARCIGFTQCDESDFNAFDQCTVCNNEFPVGSETRRVCNRTARFARDRNLGSDANVILHARSENPPTFYLRDDPGTPDQVEIIFRNGEMRIAIIADRDGDALVAGVDLEAGENLDLDSVPECSLETLGTNIDCLIWSTCVDMNIEFAVGVVEVGEGDNVRPQLTFEVIGRDESAEGVECQGSFETPDLDFLNSEAVRDRALDGMEDRFREDTPPFEADALDFGGLVQFVNMKLITIANCSDPSCDPAHDDYLAITGDLISKGLGDGLAEKLCQKFDEATATTENTGACETEGGSGDDDEVSTVCD